MAWMILERGRYPTIQSTLRSISLLLVFNLFKSTLHCCHALGRVFTIIQIYKMITTGRSRRARVMYFKTDCYDCSGTLMVYQNEKKSADFDDFRVPEIRGR